MVSVILFEHFPLPLTVDDLKAGGAQKVIDAFGANATTGKIVLAHQR